MTSNIFEHVGSRIRMYRKLKNITMSELAHRIHKSSSTMSKYESGQIAMTIDTLSTIANALDIRISQLIDYDAPDAHLSAESRNSLDESFYMYLCQGKSKRIIKSLLKLSSLYNDNSAMLFYDVPDYLDLTLCKHLYYGKVAFYDNLMSLELYNQGNFTEHIYVNLFRPLYRTV